LKKLRRKKKRAKPLTDHEMSQLKENMALSVKEKLDRLESLNEFVNAFVPKKNKKIWEELKKRGA